MSKPKGPPPGAGGPPPSGGSEDIASSEEESEEDLLLKMLEEATEAYKTNSLTQLLEAFSTNYNEDTNSLLNYSA